MPSTMTSQANGPVAAQDAAPAPIATKTANGNPKSRSVHSPPGPKPDQSSRDSSSTPDADDSADEFDNLFEEPDAFQWVVNDADVCTLKEARQIRQHLQKFGADRFVLEHITNERYTARKLCTAFAWRGCPAFMADCPDEDFYRPLGRLISQEMNRRGRLEQYQTIDDAARLLNESNNIMVITGAGISTSLGIPDFRSKNTGFYSKLIEMGYSEPEQVFDIDAFDADPRTFYQLAGEIVPDLRKWTPTHQFIRLLQDKGKLLTNYTQNIDNVEAHAGIRKDKLIQCHGSWASATCRECKFQVPGEQIFSAVRARIPATCPRCEDRIAHPKPGMKRKRSANNAASKKRRAGVDDSDSNGEFDIPQPGIMKPDITFFGEALPTDFFTRIKEHDHAKVDLVLVIGTSMKVAPVSEIPNFLPRSVPQIYISRDPIHHINFDVNLLGESDVVVAELARRAGWHLAHAAIPADHAVDVTLVDVREHRSTVVPRAAPKTSPPSPRQQQQQHTETKTERGATPETLSTAALQAEKLGGLASPGLALRQEGGVARA